MPVYNVDIQKVRFGVYWTNRYQILRDEPGLTLAEVNAFHAAEYPFHGNSVQYVSLRISDQTPNTDNFAVWPLQGAGLIPDGGAAIPGFCTLRADIPVGFGRPCRKYYRVYVGEDKIIGGNWEPSFIVTAQAAIRSLAATVTGLCDPQGNPWGDAVVKNAIQMRQLRRGTKRPLTPVIPVA